MSTINAVTSLANDFFLEEIRDIDAAGNWVACLLKVKYSNKFLVSVHLYRSSTANKWEGPYFTIYSTFQATLEEAVSLQRAIELAIEASKTYLLIEK